MCVFWWTASIYYIMEEEKGKKEWGDRGWRFEAGGKEVEYTIQFVVDQMLYPQAKYFTPNATCKTPSVEMGSGICQH